MLIKVVNFSPKGVCTGLAEHASQNLVQGRLVNGSLGQVVGFQSLSEARGRDTEVAEVDKSRDPVIMQGRDHSEEPMEGNQVVPVDSSWPVVRFINGQTLLLTPGTLNVIPGNQIFETDHIFKWNSRW